MAQHGPGITPHNRAVGHDGAVRCALCLDEDAGAGHDWCPAAGCMVCDECCRGLASGDPDALVSLVVASGRPSLEFAVRECAACTRRIENPASYVIPADADLGPAC